MPIHAICAMASTRGSMDSYATCATSIRKTSMFAVSPYQLYLTFSPSDRISASFQVAANASPRTATRMSTIRPSESNNARSSISDSHILHSAASPNAHLYTPVVNAISRPILPSLQDGITRRNAPLLHPSLGRNLDPGLSPLASLLLSL
jgi:hypothetical protein